MKEFTQNIPSLYSKALIASGTCCIMLSTSFCIYAEEEETPHVIHLAETSIIADTNIDMSQTPTTPSIKTHDKMSQNNSIAPETPNMISRCEPFTGKIVGSRVRLRLNPSLDSPIIKELVQGDIWVICGEVDNFYAVRPKNSMRGYIFRTYILDNVVEGNNVNMRSQPDTQAPIITQLHQGEKVSAEMCQDNPKWMEVRIPQDVSFFVAKEYVKRIGNESLAVQLEKKYQEILGKLTDLKDAVDKELQKPFHDIRLTPIANQLKDLSLSATDWNDIIESIQKLILHMQEEYLKLSMIEQTKPVDLPPPQEATLPKEPENSSNREQTTHSNAYTLQLQENKIVEEAIRSGTCRSEAEFYDQEAKKSFSVRGILVPYDRLVRNRPGDFILIDASSKVPLAYVYSTRVALKDLIGKPLTFYVTERPNHYFALPAYFVVDESASLFK